MELHNEDTKLVINESLVCRSEEVRQHETSDKLNIPRTVPIKHCVPHVRYEDLQITGACVRFTNHLIIHKKASLTHILQSCF